MSADPQKIEDDTDEMNIMVAVRCRGRNKREIKSKSSVIVSVPDVMGSNEISINTSDDIVSGLTAQLNSKTYTVDKVFGPSANQRLIFEEIAEPLFNDFLRGYNCTVLVYGMTSTGKTYTMTGDEKLYKGDLSDSAGIIPRVLFKLFETIEFQSDNYVIKCSFIELYNEELKDLLIDSNNTKLKKLRIFDSNLSKSSNNNNISRQNSHFISGMDLRKNPINPINNSNDNTAIQNGNASIYIQNLEEFHIKNAREGIQLLQKGLKYRQVASTKMNDVSSRSHTIFTINLYKEHKGEIFKISKMNLVDLAGSENISRSGAQNQRAKEAGSINQSLLTLGRVINSIADKNIHIPFRESKLTRLLQDSLGGNTKTALIATISPAKLNAEETCSTLEYATKAKSIKNKPQLGSIIMKDVRLKDLNNELAKIKRDLTSTKQKDGVYMTQNHYKDLTNDLESYKTEIQECDRIVKSLELQNALLLKDKKASNEVNKLQELNLNEMTNTLSNIQTTLEIQHKKEQILVEELAHSREKSLKMKTVIKEYSEKEERIQSNMKSIFNDELIKLKELLIENLNGIAKENLIVQTNVKDNIKLIKDDVISIVTESQELSKKLFLEFSQQIIKETPLILEMFSSDVKKNQELNETYFANLFENLESIKQQYSKLNEYFSNDFFKSNHVTIVNDHVNTTKAIIEKSVSDIFKQFQQNMEAFAEQNEKLILENLKTVSSDLIQNEMNSFKEHKSEWDISFKKINHCDYLNNSYHDQMHTYLRNMKGKLQSSDEIIKKHMNQIKSNVDSLNSTPKLLNTDRAIGDNYNQIISKRDKLHDHLQISLNSTQNSLLVFDEICKSIQFAFANYSKTNLQESALLKGRLFADIDPLNDTNLNKQESLTFDKGDAKLTKENNEDMSSKDENKLNNQNVTLIGLKRSHMDLNDSDSPLKSRRIE
ncbi:hypothetical protein TPHA_0M00240 [Tetrapisispora phaffii CBS 4417]|uniref:Kinesin-like protein n=1 Tax=Tetrapisispora phaffii (strain ATCC 24235 / CBS 4417 / NBRC 1672 / NRRL Y-8282 / UCD 70-5) TaxID=1071381 RepID=G8C0U1_TETPH|nr:hypothetical protein TPHA_0M00240 [Tetrapisispora phaffii CBS 4417]CCE65602.1 hypothetical protein TPHA_0M00240 [Tetrapisispora phaffii CBS 4417]